MGGEVGGVQDNQRSLGNNNNNNNKTEGKESHQEQVHVFNTLKKTCSGE